MLAIKTPMNLTFPGVMSGSKTAVITSIPSQDVSVKKRKAHAFFPGIVQYPDKIQVSFVFEICGR